jgi:MFS family permease
METKYHSRLHAIGEIATLALPALIAISLLQLVTLSIYLHGPVSNGTGMFLIWNTLQIIPAFVFGYISDKNYRKTSLLVSQCLGLMGGMVLYVFGAKSWVLILIALTFNPMPVARAALLDNFPQHSTLKLVAITFIAQNLPWAFYKTLSLVSFDAITQFTLIALAANFLLTLGLFKDKKDQIHPKVEQKGSLEMIGKDHRIWKTFIAFTLAELTFYLLFVFVESRSGDLLWLDFTTIGTLIGILIVMVYQRLPHMSIITLLYSIGAGMAVVALTICNKGALSCENSLLSAMSHYAVIGGMYLPFVTDAMIKMFGPRHKALGSAVIEFGDTAAIFLAPLLQLALKPTPSASLLTILLLYAVATVLQKSAEHLKGEAPG